MNDLFTLNSSGIKTHRDHFVIDIDINALQKRVERFYDLTVSDDDIRREMDLKDNRDWQLNIARRKAIFDKELIETTTYRPFDNQTIYYDANLIDFGRQNVMRHMLAGENLGLVAVVQSQAANLDYFDCLFISNKVTDVNMFRRGGPTLFALYTYPDSNDLLATTPSDLWSATPSEEGELLRTPNLNTEIVQKIALGLGLSFTPEKAATPSLRATPSKEGELKPADFIPLQNEGVARSDGVVKNNSKLADLPYNPALKERARELRKAGNLSEVLFWNAVKNKQLDDLDFDRQRVIGNYIVDFYCHEYSVVVEIDGSSHDDKQEYDAERDAYLRGLGLNVLHVQDIEVKKNLSGVIELVRQNTTTPSLRATLSKEGELKTFAPIDLLDYIYAVLHSPNYRETYKEFLKIDFPRVPYPTDAAQFWQLVALGGALRQTHLLENAPTKSDISYPIGGNNVVDKPSFDAGKVFINATQYFENVPPIAWGFYIGGYQPAQKWLKDRKGRALNMDDVQHYQKIIHALCETHRLMAEVDNILQD
ncbi:MAG: DUF559 domain-containing protein [Methylotenera sp.]|uniref:type ISP restriction/modification enzyme n=1 Tax=Methylotenera sp. TaxID=2051956 RepID=UPI0024877BA7|nr:type ISP restriction/modification enzyme [Methylotenera sp.]MDI1307924.1 DUF559 domain-containing protein [Methylotenera sp.]